MVRIQQWNTVPFLLLFPLAPFCALSTLSWAQQTAQAFWHPLFFPKSTPTDFLKILFIEEKCIYCLFCHGLCFLFLLLLPFPLPVHNPGVVYFCEQVARARTGMSTSLRQQWKITWKGHDCDKVSLHLSVEKYKASVDFAELIRSRMIWSQTSPSLT